MNDTRIGDQGKEEGPVIAVYDSIRWHCYGFPFLVPFRRFGISSSVTARFCLMVYVSLRLYKSYLYL